MPLIFLWMLYGRGPSSWLFKKKYPCGVFNLGKSLGYAQWRSGCLLFDYWKAVLMREGWKSNFVPNQVLFPCPSFSSFPLFSGQTRNLRPVIWLYLIPLCWLRFDCEVKGWKLTHLNRERRGGDPGSASLGSILRGGVKIWGLIHQGRSPYRTK